MAFSSLQSRMKRIERMAGRILPAPVFVMFPGGGPARLTIDDAQIRDVRYRRANDESIDQFHRRLEAIALKIMLALDDPERGITILIGDYGASENEDGGGDIAPPKLPRKAPPAPQTIEIHAR